jgi:DNA-binding NtrC family response regulator
MVRDDYDSCGLIVVSPLPLLEMRTVDEISSVDSESSGVQGRVLLVDDEVAVRRFAGRVLERAGYGVFEAEDGIEALELLDGPAAAADVVVSDIVMPRLNGVELMQALANSRPELPVILMTGYATSALTERGILVPCGVLSKPFPGDRLLDEVRRCIRPRR